MRESRHCPRGVRGHPARPGLRCPPPGGMTAVTWGLCFLSSPTPEVTVETADHRRVKLWAEHGKGQSCQQLSWAVSTAATLGSVKPGSDHVPRVNTARGSTCSQVLAPSLLGAMRLYLTGLLAARLRVLLSLCPGLLTIQVTHQAMPLPQGLCTCRILLELPLPLPDNLCNPPLSRGQMSHYWRVNPHRSVQDGTCPPAPTRLPVPVLLFSYVSPLIRSFTRLFAVLLIPLDVSSTMGHVGCCVPGP